MSEQSQGFGWWQAADGRWYPPESHPGRASGWWVASDGRWYPPEARSPSSGPRPVAPRPTTSWWQGSTAKAKEIQQRAAEARDAGRDLWESSTTKAKKLQGRAVDARDTGRDLWDRAQAAVHDLRPDTPEPYPATAARPSPWRRGWSRFRGWPTWAQATSWVLIGVLLLAAIGSGGDTDDDGGQGEQQQVAAVAPATTAVTRTTEHHATTTAPPRTTLPPAPTTTVDPVSLLTPAELAAIDRLLNPPPPTTIAPQPVAPACDPHYTDGCVPIASDVDCAGGSGDGPAYSGFARVGSGDPYGLDSDGDGLACES